VKDLPYFRWWVARAETDDNYRAMTDQELGFYHRCLNLAWVNGGLPADLDALARLMRVRRSYLDKLWPAVGKCWFENDGKLLNRVQESEREHVISKSLSAAESAKVRYERSASALRTHYHARYDSVSVSSSQKTEEQKIPLRARPRFETDEAFMRFRTKYESCGQPFLDEDYTEAFELFWRKLDFEQKLARVKAVDTHRKDYCSGPRFVPKPLKFLQTEWKRTPRSTLTAPKPVDQTPTVYDVYPDLRSSKA
jgi:hypothetical protein